MLEKPLLGEMAQPEGDYLRVITFDTGKAEDRPELKFKLAEGAAAIGDFNFIDATRARIERDNGEGDASLACAADAQDKSACYPVPARVKHIVLVDTSRIDADGFIHRIGYIDLMT